MHLRPLGRTDLTVSSWGLGCVTFGREIDTETSFRVLDHAFEQGIRLLDTAPAYNRGASETVVGEWLSSRKRRGEIVVATKVNGVLNREHILRSVDESLQRLQTDRVDLLQLHHWDAQTPLDETLAALDEVVCQGKARWLGCSNFTCWQMATALLQGAKAGGPRLESVQPPYNLLQREIEPEILPLCADREIGILSYSPLGAGFFTGKYQRGQPFPAGTRFDVVPGHEVDYFTDRGFRVLAGLQQAASETGRSTIDLALAWIAGRPGITSVLIGARDVRHIDQAVEAERRGLAPELRARLDAL